MTAAPRDTNTHHEPNTNPTIDHRRNLWRGAAMRPTNEGRLRLWLWPVLALALALVPGSSQSTVRLHLQEDRIADHNDTEYVHAVMRLAKAAEMRNYMEPTADPCDDFFEFACGNWAKINPAQKVSPRETNFFALLTKGYALKQLRLLKEGHRKQDTVVETMVKNYYESCLNVANDRAGYRARVRALLADFGAMPALSASWDGADDFDLLATVGRIHRRFGLNIVLNLVIRKDFEDHSVNKLFVGQLRLRLQSKSMYLEEMTKPYRDLYREEIAQNLRQHLGLADEVAERTAAQVLDFEVRLARGMTDSKLGLTMRAESRLRTVAELQAAYAPDIDFERYLELALGHRFNGTLYEFRPEYQANLVRVLRETGREQQANYVFYQLAEYFFLDAEGSLAQREKVCLKHTKAFFAKPIDNSIYRRYNTRAMQRDIQQLWRELKATFRAQLETSPQLAWMSPMTRRLAVEKLEAMRLEINSYEETDFEREYANLTGIDARDFLANLRRCSEFEARRSLARLYERPRPVNAPGLFSFTPVHIGFENLIRMPVSLLQPNFLWSAHYPNALKFGTLGYLVAHELIHGFDDRGSGYDAAGLERAWWDANSTAAFVERKECFKDQYHRFRYGGKYLPENELQSENIADNGAVHVAYSAYTHWLQQRQRQHPPEPPVEGAEAAETTAEALPPPLEEVEEELELLPNMNFTSRQLFFISFAQFWCNDVNEQFKDHVSLIDDHAPAKFRVIGSLANFPAFAEEFRCERGSTMNPPKRCTIY